MGMRTATKQKPSKNVNWEVEDRQKDLLFQKHGVLPCEVNEEGYFYDEKATMKILKDVKAEKANELRAKNRN